MTPIQQATAQYFKISIKNLCKSSRQAYLVKARRIACYLEYKAGKSYSEIAKAYNYNDHSAALASVKYVATRLELDMGTEDHSFVDDVGAIQALVDLQRGGENKMVEALACPTCGAPVVTELRRQIALLHARVNELSTTMANK